MRNVGSSIPLIALCSLAFFLSSCSSTHRVSGYGRYYPPPPPPDYTKRLPSVIETSEKVVVVNPRVHAWGAYDASGNLVKAGLATAGSNWCPDIGRPCRTSTGHFRIVSLGSVGCKSKTFPVHRGGAPMPYCMYFHNGEALHGVPSGEVVEGNISHGCVRMRIPDAEWLRFNFAEEGTKVIVEPYN